MKTVAFHPLALKQAEKRGNAVSNVLEHWIPVCCDAYDENVFMPCIKESLQQRTAALFRACLRR